MLVPHGERGALHAVCVQRSCRETIQRVPLYLIPDVASQLEQYLLDGYSVFNPSAPARLALNTPGGRVLPCAGRTGDAARCTGSHGSPLQRR